MPVINPPYKRDRRGYEYYHERRQWRPPQPRATYWLLGTIVAVFVLELVVAVGWGALAQAEVFAIHVDWMYRPWTLVLSTLAHADFTHLFFNGLFLYFFGPTIENIVGRRNYLALFFVTGAVSGIVQVQLAYGYALGASGALMALFGVSLILIPNSKMFVFPVPVPVPLWIGGIFFVLADVAGAFNPYSTVGNFAHLSGLALGLLFGLQVKKGLARRGVRIEYA